MKNIFAVVGVVVLVAVAGVGGFFAGNSFGPNAQAQSVQREFFAQRFGNGGQGGAGQFNQGGQGGAQNAQGGPNGQGGQAARRPIAFGTVKSVQGNTIQVTAQDGTVTTITTDSKTVVEKTVAGAVVDVQVGQRVTVMGAQTGSDMVATQIAIQPSGQGTQ
ncbi:MAG TPA: hypothetical protein VF478_02425 [Anaerolineae bacterium]